ncbi:MAG: hypothetical protein LBM28_01465 [Oscillospiraceae bacterium]|jgi:hypothetical protein|nr:hypothetical protein [Oscillospiraceae bacterium]
MKHLKQWYGEAMWYNVKQSLIACAYLAVLVCLFVYIGSIDTIVLVVFCITVILSLRGFRCFVPTQAGLYSTFLGIPYRLTRWESIAQYGILYGTRRMNYYLVFSLQGCKRSAAEAWAAGIPIASYQLSNPTKILFFPYSRRNASIIAKYFREPGFGPDCYKPATAQNSADFPQSFIYKADMYMPGWLCNSGIFLIATGCSMIILSISYNLYVLASCLLGLGALLLGILAVLGYKNQRITLLSEDEFMYRSIWGKEYRFRFRDIQKILTSTDTTTLVLPGKKIRIESMFVVSRRLSERLQQERQRLR